MTVLIPQGEQVMKRSNALATAALASLIGAFAVGPAAAQGVERVQAGVLSCDVSGGLGLIIGSQKQMRCLFTPSTPGWRLRPDHLVAADLGLGTNRSQRRRRGD
jgi:uncharacterized protein DUF992